MRVELLEIECVLVAIEISTDSIEVIVYPITDQY